ncbi:MAG: hypothetical protein SGJ20_01145 [Planctomycetota bacterium]|nr:hypothetical protein [Planctomycetota bacterium]
MSFGTRLKGLWSSCFSRPTADRTLLRQVGDRPLRRLVELGISDPERTLRLIQSAKKRNSGETIEYVGIDPFEMRSAENGEAVTLKEIHCKLRATEAKIKLVPGDPFSALARIANSLSGIDLVLISDNVDAQTLARAWFYLPRILAPTSLVLWADKSDPEAPEAYREVSREELSQLSGSQSRRRAA